VRPLGPAGKHLGQFLPEQRAGRQQEIREEDDGQRGAQEACRVPESRVISPGLASSTFWGSSPLLVGVVASSTLLAVS
jgi:hypothetical protein